MTSQVDRTTAAADLIEGRAHGHLAADNRIVAVQQVASGAAREVTARLAHDAGYEVGCLSELHLAHQLIAELAVRLAELRQ